MTTPRTILDFDDIAEWSPRLAKALSPHLPADIDEKLKATNPEFVEDALAVLFEHSKRAAVLAATSDWIKAQAVRGYHGTRVLPQERASILEHGIRPLVAAEREARLRRALSGHPRWGEVEGKLAEAIERLRPHREGQAHLTVSRSGLVRGFNHYLKQGSEFDWHVAHRLLGEEGQALISTDGVTCLVKALVPGDRAFAACNPWGVGDDIPNLVRDILEVWAYRLAHPNYQSASLRLDCGMIFREAIPAAWIEEIEDL